MLASRSLSSYGHHPLDFTGELHELSEELIAESFQMNFMSTALMCKAVLPQMMENNFGRVVLMGSIAGNNGGSGTTTPHYGPAKAAVHSLGRSLATTYAKHGINVNTLAPGVIDNGFHAAHTSEANMQNMVGFVFVCLSKRCGHLMF